MLANSTANSTFYTGITAVVLTRKLLITSKCLKLKTYSILTNKVISIALNITKGNTAFQYYAINV